MASWPASLPQDWLIAGYKEQERDGVIRDQMETGPEHARRRTSATPIDVDASIILTQTERNTFETFFESTLAKGAVEFQHYRMGRPTAGDVNYRFREPPSFSVSTLKKSGANVIVVWRCDMSLVILP